MNHEEFESIVRDFEKIENCKIEINWQEDGGWKGKIIPPERADEINPKFLKYYLSRCGHNVNIDEDDEQQFEMIGVTHTDSLRYFQLIRNYTEDNLEQKDDLIPELDRCKVFDISNSVSNLLSLTKCNYTLNKPFPNMFINCKIKIEDKFYYGFFIGNYQDNECIITISPEKIDLGFKYIFKAFQTNGEPIINISKKEIKGLMNFYNSFLSFLNEPEIILKESIRTEANNLRRIKKGKCRLPNTTYEIVLTGKLEKYLESIESLIHLRYTHKFWVRGHYIRYSNSQVWKNLYSLKKEELREKGYFEKDGIIIGWRKPHIKGHGILKNKIYNVTEK